MANSTVTTNLYVRSNDKDFVYCRCRITASRRPAYVYEFRNSSNTLLFSITSDKELLSRFIKLILSIVAYGN